MKWMCGSRLHIPSKTGTCNLAEHMSCAAQTVKSVVFDIKTVTIHSQDSLHSSQFSRHTSDMAWWSDVSVCAPPHLLPCRVSPNNLTTQCSMWSQNTTTARRSPPFCSNFATISQVAGAWGDRSHAIQNDVLHSEQHASLLGLASSASNTMPPQLPVGFLQ